MTSYSPGPSSLALARERPFRRLGLLLLLASLASSQDSCVIDVVNYTPQNLTIFTYDGSDTKCINPFETYIVPPPYLPGNQAGYISVYCDSWKACWVNPFPDVLSGCPSQGLHVPCDNDVEIWYDQEGNLQYCHNQAGNCRSRLLRKLRRQKTEKGSAGSLRGSAGSYNAPK